MSHNIIYLLNKICLLRNDRFKYLKLSRKALWTACIAVLKRAIFGVVLLLSAFARCGDPFACLVMSSEWCCQMKEWHSEHMHHANLSPFSQRLMESELESDTWFFLLHGCRCSGLFNIFKVTNSESCVMTIIDHKKQRCHGDGAVYFMHSMAPCILWSVIMTVTGSSC